jgi:hypothetical protein
MSETMYYVYSKKSGHLITKTTDVEVLKLYIPELVEVVIK